MFGETIVLLAVSGSDKLDIIRFFACRTISKVLSRLRCYAWMHCIIVRTFDGGNHRPRDKMVTRAFQPGVVVS